ncbi:MAG TPA: O-antigen ligase family protein [Thermoanaerobaculia bacterium]|nr:O-antigen ligase family protein [Thermoanaerobaculia bacterium]
MSVQEPVHRSSLIVHRSLLIRLAAVAYILHILFHPKIALLMIWAFATVLAIAWAIARGDARFSFHVFYYPLILFGAVSTISALAADRRIHSWGENTLWFKMLIFPAALILFREAPRIRERVLYAYALLAGGSSVWALIQFAFLGYRDLEHRISGPASHVMTFSGILLPLSLMFLLLWWHERKPLWLAVTVISTITLLLTFTRSVWIGWMAAVLVLLMLVRSRVRFYALPALLLFITLLPLPLFSRLMSTFDLREESNFDRIRMIEAGVEMIKDHPLLGVGPANVKEAYPLYKKHDAPRARPPHLHNNFVQLWAERGILGLAAYLVLIGLVLRQCAIAWRGGNRMWAEIGVAVTVSLTVAGLFEFNFGDTEVFYLMLNLFALLAASTQEGGRPVRHGLTADETSALHGPNVPASAAVT